MSLLDRYILREWAKVFSLCIICFSGLLLISEGYNWIPELLSWGSSLATIGLFLWTKLVGGVSMLLPISLLISVVFVLSAMNRNQELAAIRAAGIGMWRLTLPLWAVGLALAFLLAALNAWWVPDALDTQRNILDREKFAAIKRKGGTALPVGESGSVCFENPKSGRLWRISRLGLTIGQAFEVEVHLFDPKHREVRCVSARFADFQKTAGRWHWSFRQGRDMHFDAATGTLLSQPAFQELSVPELDDDPEIMLYAERDAELLSLREVARFIDQTGQNASGRNAMYAMRYHSILAGPIICLVVVAVAIPFSVVGGRVSPMIGVAKTFGLFLAFFFISSVCNAFGNSGALPPVLAAWLPAIITALWAIPKLRSVN